MTLTPRQTAVLAFVRDYVAEMGYAPSVRDVARWLGCSVHCAYGHLNALERHGAIERKYGVPRGIRVTGVTVASIKNPR